MRTEQFRRKLMSGAAFAGLGAAALFAASPAAAQSVVIDAGSVSGTATGVSAPGELAGQTWVAPNTAAWLNKFEFDAFQGTETFYISAWNGSAPTGPVLFSQTVSNASAQPVTLYTNGLQLTAGQSYIVYAGRNGATSYGVNANGYASGLFYETISSAWTPVGGGAYDWVFTAAFSSAGGACGATPLNDAANVCAVDSTLAAGAGADALGGTDTLQIGDATDYSFDAGRIGTDFVNFEGVEKVGAGTLTLTGTGGTTPITVSGGTLVGTSTAIQGDVVNNAALIFDNLDEDQTDDVGPAVYAGAISGSGHVTFTNGYFQLTGANTYSGGTTVDDAVVAGTTTSIQGDVTLANNGVVAFDQAANGTYAGNIDGVGVLAKAGTGDVTLTGTNTFTGAISISGGRLIGDVDAINQNVSVLSGATVVFDQATDATYSANINGGGALQKQGAGTLTLTGTSNYDGGTTVSAGKLVGDTDSLQGAITVAGGAQLEFAMTSNGTFQGTGGSGTFGAISGSGSVIKSGTGALTLGGASTYNGGTSIAGGSIELDHLDGLGTGTVNMDGGSLRFDADGTFDNGVNFNTTGGVVSAAAGRTVTIQGAIGVGNGDAMTFGSATDTGVIVLDAVGSSVWSTSTVTVAGGTLRGVGSDLSFFTSAAASTTVAAGATLDFSTSTAATVFNLQGAGTVAAGANQLWLGGGSFDGVLTGTGGLRKYSSGTLRLSGTNTLTGATTIASGTLTVADGAALSDTSAVTVISPGTLDVEDSETIGSLAGSGSVTLQAGAVLTTGGDDTSTTFSGGISGLGGLVKTGTGVFTLTGTNTYSGGTTVLAGELVGTTDSLQGDIANDAEVSFDQSANGTYAGEMTGTGSLNKRGTGTVTLTGSVDLDGGTTIEAGTLISVDGALSGDVTNDGVLGLSQTAGVATFAGDIDGTGSVRKLGAGELVLTGDNSYSGGTSVEEGALVGAVGALQGDIDVFAGATVEFAQGSDAAYDGALSGDGALVKSGAGKLTLTGTNALTGGMTVEAGALEGTADNLVGAITNNGQVIFAQGSTGTYAGVMDGTGALVKTGNGVLTLTGANSYSGGTTISGGGLKGTTSSIQGDVVNNGQLVFDDATGGIFAGNLSGTGDVTFQGGGTFELTGANTSTGDMTIDGSGVLGDTDSIAGDISLVGGSVTFDQEFDGTYAGDITGSGGLTKHGNGSVRLTGSTSHTGGTWVSAGSLIGDTTSLRGDIGTYFDGYIVFDQGFDATFNGTLWGFGGIVKQGAGRLTIADAQIMDGLSRLEAGRLIVNGAIGDLQVTGGVLSGTGTIGDLTVLAGTVLPGASIGTLTVNGDLVLGAGSLLEIEANATSSDRIVATGGATLQGGDVYLSVLPQLYAPGTTWTILQAGSVTGAFGDLTASQSFGLLEARFQYDANAVRIALEFEPDNLYQYAETPNQLEAASGVAGLPNSSALLTALVYAPTDDLAHALDQLSGEVQASLASALIDDTSFQRDATLTRLRNHDASTPGWAVWGAARADQASLEGDVGVATLERSRQAFLTGADYTFDNGLRLGLAIGADQGEARIDERASTADTSGWLAEAYGRMDFGRTSLRFGAGWGWQDVTTTRTVVVGLLTESNTGETEATTANAFVDLSRTWDKDGFEFEPFIGAGWAKAELDGYTEVGGSSALTLGSVEADTTFAVAGLRASREFELSGGLVKPYGSLAWEHPFGDIEPAVDNSFIAAPTAPFVIRGASLDQGRALMDLGVSWEKDNIKVGVTYEGAASEEFQRHGGKLYARVAF